MDQQVELAQESHTDSLTALDKKIVELVFERCTALDGGKCPAGNLVVYLWHTLGGRGEPPGEFHVRVQGIMGTIGHKHSLDSGHRYFKGLVFKGESCKCGRNYKSGCTCYRNPQAEDLPKWISARVHFRYVTSDGRTTIHKPNAISLGSLGSHSDLSSKDEREDDDD